MIDVTVVMMGCNYASTTIGPIEVFASAGALWNQLRGEAAAPRFRVTTVSTDGRPIVTAYGVRLTPDASLDAVERTDLVVVSAIGVDLDDVLTGQPQLFPWLCHHAARGAYIAGMCTGAAGLAAAGLLEGHEATTHWAVAETYRARFPNVLWRPEKLITEDRRMFCSGGVYASLDLSLYLVAKLCGRELALQTARTLVLDMPRSLQSPYAVLPLSRPHDDAAIRRAEAHLTEHCAQPLAIESLAHRQHMSARNFIRRFKAATGRTPGAYLQAARVAVAKELLERGARSVQEVGTTVGYEDAAFFRALFRRETGMTPTEYRERFGRGGVTAPPKRATASRRAAGPR